MTPSFAAVAGGKVAVGLGDGDPSGCDLVTGRHVAAGTLEPSAGDGGLADEAVVVEQTPRRERRLARRPGRDVGGVRNLAGMGRLERPVEPEQRVGEQIALVRREVRRMPVPTTCRTRLPNRRAGPHGDWSLPQVSYPSGGRGMAIAGIVLGWVGIGLLILTIVLAVAASGG